MEPVLFLGRLYDLRPLRLKSEKMTKLFIAPPNMDFAFISGALHSKKTPTTPLVLFDYDAYSDCFQRLKQIED